MLAYKPVVNFKDKRGVIIDLLEKRNINAITYISFTKGAVRANHVHKKTIQHNYVISGKVKIVTQFGNKKKNSKILTKGDLATTIANEKHALLGLSKAEIMVFTEGPRGGKEYEKDTFRLAVPLIK